ncbi:hypothetical protein HHK36_001662 [Tetracentron sinense]|uniref:Seipin n=1 Tax=Tetracentron sinense TaxID=13715 RepID=A0A834ZXP3_TETSI|nr:hypothetical protein HHK36_001662 [Tetracentron sinense]
MKTVTLARNHSFSSMEETKIVDDRFVNSLDEFSFFDCNGIAESGKFGDFSRVSRLEFVEDGADEIIKPKKISFNDSKDSSCNSLVISETPRKKRIKIYRALNENEKVFERSDSPRFRLCSDHISGIYEQNHERSLITSANKEHFDDSISRDLDEFPSKFLVFLAGLVIKVIGFQISFLISFFTFPIWFLYCSLMFVIDPFQIVRWARKYLTRKLLRILGIFCGSVSPFKYEELKGQKSMGKLAMRFGRGFLWSIYVCFILFGFLVSAFVIGGLMTKYLVEEPIQMSETLNFDYTKTSPVAFFPLISCPPVSCGMGCKENAQIEKDVESRLVPPNHKLLVAVSLTLPESEYNRKLGVFQVRVDFLSANGKVTASSIYPSMLRFKSQPIRYLETFLKTAPLVAGYSSESQILKLKMRDFTEGYEPTACLKVILEQRAEYQPGAGIPEIYAASLMLETELPLIKRIIWYWRKTLFIWTSMVSFIMEILLILVFCRPIIIPRARPRDYSAKNSSPSLIKGV